MPNESRMSTGGTPFQEHLSARREEELPPHTAPAQAAGRKAPQMGSLTFSQFRRLQVQDQGARRAGSWRGPFCWPPAECLQGPSPMRLQGKPWCLILFL